MADAPSDSDPRVTAGFVSRLAAFGIDAVLIATMASATAWMMGSLHEASPHFFAPAWAAWSALVSLPLVGVLYDIGFWTFGGQTPGKWALGIRVVTREGHPMTLARSTLRLFAYLVSALPLYAGFLWILVDRERLGWHDRIAHTRVVYTRDALKFARRAPA